MCGTFNMIHRSKSVQGALTALSLKPDSLSQITTLSALIRDVGPHIRSLTLYMLLTDDRDITCEYLCHACP